MEGADDAVLVGNVSQLVSAALKQAGNRSLARRVIDSGARAVNLDAFHSRMKEYGSFSREACAEIFALVNKTAGVPAKARALPKIVKKMFIFMFYFSM